MGIPLTSFFNIRFFLASLALAFPLSKGVAGSVSGTAADWIYLRNSDLKVGIIKSSGAGIGYFSKAGSTKNLLNHYDRGRLIQQSYYGDVDGSKWVTKEWRYNPVQGGDYKGKSPSIPEIKKEGNSLYARSIPLHWASGEELSECLMEQWISLEEKVMHVRYTFTYNGTKTHAPGHQELPAIFLDASLDKLVTYDGETPWMNGPLTNVAPGVANEYIKMTENWVAYVNKRGEGVGAYVPSVVEATCYRFRDKNGGDVNCSYVAPIRTFSLTPGLRYSYDAYFTIGTIAEIRERFLKIHTEISTGKRPGRSQP